MEFRELDASVQTKLKNEVLDMQYDWITKQASTQTLHEQKIKKAEQGKNGGKV